MWALAVRLAGGHGVSRTALALGLDYYPLRKPLEAVAGQEAEARRRGVGLVELPPTTLPGSAACELDLVDGRGSRLRIQLRDGAAARVEAVARALWQARR